MGEFEIFAASIFNALAGPPTKALWTSRIPEPFPLGNRPLPFDLMKRIFARIFPKTRPAPEIQVWEQT
jgi:hypothetical protein